MRNIMNREQDLVDIMFQIAITIANNVYFDNLSNEEIAIWVAKQLKECGFETKPSGMSWGKLQ